MGGGDLNQKKSWHPHTLKNQERVWKAEQNEAEEKRKLAELQREITAERSRDELRRIGQASGIIGGKDESQKLEWMYRGPKENLNREDYLLGRTVDKTFEQFAEEERSTENHLGVSVPKNHVEYECVPFSIRAYKDADPTTVQVDMVRKMAEDPLMMIKQREMESRKKLLENPVKLKELKQLLQSERGGREKRDKDKKKSKKEKKKSKKKKSKRSRSESSNSDSDVDDALLAMLSKQRAVVDDEEVDMEDMDFQDVVNLKYDTLNKELDKMIKGGDKKRQEKQKESDFDEGQNNGDKRYGRQEEGRSGRMRSHSKDRNARRNRNEERMESNRGGRERNLSPRRPLNYSERRLEENKRHQPRNRSRSRDNNKRMDGRGRSRSPEQRINRDRQRSRERVEESHRRSSKSSHKRSPSIEKPKKRRSRSPKQRKREREHSRSSHDHSSRHNRQPSESREREPEQARNKRDTGDSDDERRPSSNRNYGLVTASGESIALKNTAKSYTDKRTSTATSKESSKSDSAWKRPPPKKQLTDEEKQQKLREMIQDAQSRDVERESYVRKYYENDRKEEDHHRGTEFDRNFIHKELHKSAQSETVESRLKSNRNNIQRSSSSMNTNFARR